MCSCFFENSVKMYILLNWKIVQSNVTESYLENKIK